MKARRLETVRLILEPLEPRHALKLYLKLSDPRIYAYIPQDPPESVEALESNYRRRVRGKSSDGAEIWLNWALCLRDAGEPIGHLEATIYECSKTAAIAYLLCPQFQRKGYAREGCRKMLEYLMADLKLTRITADIDTRNLPSIRLVESIGLARVATRKNVDFFKGKSSDEYRYELIAAAGSPGLATAGLR